VVYHDFGNLYITCHSLVVFQEHALWFLRGWRSNVRKYQDQTRGESRSFAQRSVQNFDSHWMMLRASGTIPETALRPDDTSPQVAPMLPANLELSLFRKLQLRIR